MLRKDKAVAELLCIVCCGAFVEASQHQGSARSCVGVLDHACSLYNKAQVQHSVGGL